MKDHLTVASEAARTAGAMLHSQFGKIATIERKKDRTLVTNLDKESERMIVDTLLSSFPDYGVIGEEGGKREGKGRYTWIIDPIDGTHNYIRCIPLYGVCIGLMRDTEIVAGVIYMPPESELYAAESGSGAFKNGRKIEVSSCSSLEESACSFDSVFRHEPRKIVAVLEKVATRVGDIRIMSSSARNLTLLAEGKIDLVIEFNDWIWDYAAGVAIIREAGGKVTNHQGGLEIGERGAYVASNGHLHAKALQMVN